MPEKMEALRNLSLMLRRTFEDDRICKHYFKMWSFWSIGDEAKYEGELKNYNKKLSMLLNQHVFSVNEIIGLFKIEPFSNIKNLSSEEVKNLYDTLTRFQQLGMFDNNVIDILKPINRKMEEVNGWRISRTDYNEIIEYLKYILEGDELELEDLRDVNASLQEFMDNNKERYENCRETVEQINRIIDEARRAIYDMGDRKKGEIFESYFDQNADLWQDVTRSYNDLNQNRLKELESHVRKTVEKIL